MRANNHRSKPPNITFYCWFPRICSWVFLFGNATAFAETVFCDLPTLNETTSLSAALKWFLMLRLAKWIQWSNTGHLSFMEWPTEASKTLGRGLLVNYYVKTPGHGSAEPLKYWSLSCISSYRLFVSQFPVILSTESHSNNTTCYFPNHNNAEHLAIS